MLQNDLVHGWGLDFALRKCVEVGDHFPLSTSPFFLIIHLGSFYQLHTFTSKQPAHEKIGVVDAQWIVHQGVPSLGNQVSPIPSLLHY